MFTTSSFLIADTKTISLSVAITLILPPRWSMWRPIIFTLPGERVMQDKTASLSKDRIKLPFAASRGSEAVHYKYDHDTGEIQDVDIKPRIFGFTYDDNGTRQLSFLEDMAGDRALRKYHAAFQSVISRPVQISVNVRLHELDLAQLDLTRPVYLGQYGKYYAILKIQTSETDLCKVELLQLI